MKKNILIICIFFINIGFSFGQKQKGVSNEMLYLQESNFVHFNKPYYYRGERVWLKAFMLYADVSFSDTLSKVLYADLIDPAKNIIQKHTFKIENRAAIGDFKLADTLKAGNYLLRVYTSWNRNYGDEILQYYPIRLLDYDQVPISNAAKVKNCDYLSATADTLKVNSMVDWSISIPNIKNYSVSITDNDYVKNISESYNSNIVGEYAEEKEFDLRYPIERGLNFNGTFQTKRNKTIKISAVRKSSYEMSTIETDGKGKFSYAWDGEVPDDLLVLNVDNKTFTTLSDTSQIPPKIISPLLKPFTFESTKAPYFVKDTFEKGAIVLDQVVVKGKGVEEKFSRGNKLYGVADNIIDEKEFQNSLVSNPIMLLQGKIPGVTVSMNGDIDIRGSKTSSFTGNTKPLIMVDGVPTDGDVSYLSISQIKQIEVVKRVSTIMGARGANGIINFITKGRGFTDASKSNEPASVFNINLKGFSKNHNFQPNEAQPYFVSNEQLTKDGKIKINFKTSQNKSTYRVELIGVLENGNLVKCYKNIVVE